jgi:competence protein ComEC
MRHRPLFWTAIAFVAGVSLSSLLPLLLALWFVLTIAAGLACIALCLARKAAPLEAPGILLLFALLGAVHYRVQNLVPRDDIAHVCPPDGRLITRIEGVVSSRPRILSREPASGAQSDDGAPPAMTRFYLRRLVMELGEGGEKRAFSGTIYVSVTDALRELRHGDTVTCFGWLSRPAAPTNPGEFDFRRFLARHGVHAELRVHQTTNVQIASEVQPSQVWALLSHLNALCGKLLYDTLSFQNAALLDALVLGNQDAVGEEQKEDFNATGTRHILAISGLNVGLITAGVLGCLLFLKTPTRIANPVAVFFAFFYAFFTGSSAPAVRAAVMVGVFLLGPLFRRWSEPLNPLGLSALLIVGFDANQVFSTGFQLSFSAVLGILLLTDDLQIIFTDKSLAAQLVERQRRFSWYRALGRYVVLSACVSGAAWMATLGLSAWYFNRISPLAIVANLIVCPLSFLILQAGLFAFALSWLVPMAGNAVLVLTGWLAALMQACIHLLAQAPSGRLYVSDPSLLLIVSYHVFLIVFVSRKFLKLETRHLAVLALALFGVSSIHSNLSLEDKRGRMTLSVLNVGHGCAAFLELPDGTNLLYDVGARGHGDITSRTVAPFLWQKGVTRLDRVVLSHLDVDHYSGLASLVERFRISELILTPMSRLSSAGKEVMDLARRHGIVVSFAVREQVLFEGKGWQVEVLNPPEDPQETVLLSDNDLSLVLKPTCGKVSFLLCADIQDGGIELVSPLGDRLRADVILVPHHGGQIQRTADLVRRVRPRFAVFSAWANGPAEETLEVYRKHRARVHITGRSGAAFLFTDGSQVIYRPFGALGESESEAPGVETSEGS